MKHPRLAALSVLAAGLMMLIAGCGGGSGDSASDSSSASPKSTYTPPKYSTFDQFPGPELKRVVELGAELGIRVKAVDSMWTPEFAGLSADAGRHHLVVYVAVTPEEADRGTQHVSLLKNLAVHVKNPSNCDTKHGLPISGSSCSFDAFPVSQLTQVADNRWRTYEWEYNALHYDDVNKGMTLIGAAAFNISDKVNGTYVLCGRKDANSMFGSSWPCVPMPQPGNGNTR